MANCEFATVVVTSSGSLVVRAIVDSLADRRMSLRLIGINSKPEKLTAQDLDAFHEVPPTASPDFTPALVSILTRESPKMLIPGRDDDVLALTALAKQGIIDPALLVSGHHELAVSLRDTGTCAGFAQAYGLAFVDTVRTGHASSVDDIARLLSDTPGPWVIKPSSGQGSHGVLVSWDPRAIARSADREGHVIQPFIGQVPGIVARSGTLPLEVLDPRRDIDLQVVLGRGGQILGVAAFTSRMARGRVTGVDPLYEATALECAESYARVLSACGWRGPVNIQAARDVDGHVRPFEVNPRFSGGTWLRRLAGFDEVGLVMHSFLGSRILEG